MISIQMIKYGLADNLAFQEEEIPDIGSKELLIRVKAVGINPFDLKLISGMFQSDMDLKLPVVIGSDFSGEVVTVGDRVSSFKKGMKVFGNGLTLAGGSGSMAEYLRIKEDKLGKMPENTDFEIAAALVTPGCTAQQAIIKELQIKPHQKILIHGAAGAVGSLAVQLCLNIGAFVAVTVSEKDIPYMKQLGVDLIINYQQQPFEKLIKNYDAVLDTQGGTVLQKSYEVLKPGGEIISLVSIPEKNLLQKRNLTGKFQKSEINTQSLNSLRFLIEEKILTCKSPEIIPFPKAIDAIGRKLAGKTKRKIVVQLPDEQSPTAFFE
ncbi:MAG: NADP-dependent oxidoreductase [Bacteroidales bacterium]